MYKIFFFIVELFIIFIIGLFFYLTKPFTSSEVVFVPQGSIADIITQFKQKNYVLSDIDKFILRFIGRPQSGWINIGKEKLNRFEFLYKLTKAKAATQNITLIPGETTIIFLEQVAKKFNLDKDILIFEFNKQSPFKEGMLIPDTYKIPRNISEANFIKLLITHSERQHKEWSTKLYGEYNPKKWYKTIIMASVIQKEAASEEEMPLVASVINNRLKIGMKLQMDGTLNYGVYSHVRVSPERIRNDTSSYNTYKNLGLPQDAVCNVSIAAIKATKNPPDTPYLYFVRDKKTGKHIFSTNLNEHNKAIDGQRN